jgi:hypothetical protein
MFAGLTIDHIILFLTALLSAYSGWRANSAARTGKSNAAAINVVTDVAQQGVNAAHENAQAIQVVHTSVNSRMDELITAAKAQGKSDEQDAQSIRDKEKP